MIKEKIDKYLKLKTVRCHTPGHSGKLNSRDITELGGGEIFPADSILFAQDAVAKVFGCKALRFLTGGSSMGVKAAIMATGGDIIASEFNHQSVWEGIELSGKKAIKLSADYIDGIAMPPSLEKIENALKSNLGAAAVLVASPTYYGFCADKKLVSLVKSYGKKLIIDGAHGAHFAAHMALNEKSFTADADFCNLSAHKTLNAYTQSAYLCVNDVSLLFSVDHALKLLGTTSPSYLFLEQLEIAALEIKDKMYLYEKIRIAAEKFKTFYKCAPSDDFCRLVIDCVGLGFSGQTLYNKLFYEKIAGEMFDERHCVLIITPQNYHNIFSRLKKAMDKIVRQNIRW